MNAQQDVKPAGELSGDSGVLPAGQGPSATAVGGSAFSEGLGSSERHAARTLRIRKLQAELRALLDEEAAEVCKDLAATKAQCAAMARAGQRVEAVKLYRDKTGLSLRESLQVVESLVSAA